MQNIYGHTARKQVVENTTGHVMKTNNAECLLTYGENTGMAEYLWSFSE